MANVRLALIALLIPLALLNTGCFTLAKQAYSEVRGARGDFRLIAEHALPRRFTVEFTPATSTMGALVPGAVLYAYDHCANQAGARIYMLRTDGEPLVINSELIYYQSKGIFSAAQLLARVRMRSGETEVVDGLAVAESSSFRQGGEDALAQAAVDAIARYLDARRPPPTVPTSDARPSQ